MKVKPHLSRIKTSQRLSQQSFDIEAQLRSWGLLGHTAIQREDSRTTRVINFFHKKIIWHRFKLLILWLITIKLFYCCHLTNDNPFVYYLGDVSGFMNVPKLEMGLMMALWTLPGPIIIFEFIKFKNTKRMESWVKIYDMFNRNLSDGLNANPIEKSTDQNIRNKFRLRIHQTKRLFYFFVFGALISGGTSIVWTLLNSWPEEYRNSFWAYFWSIADLLWIYLNQKSAKSCLIIFNQICYYLTLRFRKFNTKIKQLFLNWNKFNDPKHLKLLALLREHDRISELTLSCNKFWSLFIITNSAIKTPLLLLAIHVTLFYSLSFAGRLVSIFMTSSIFLYTTLIYYSASQVEYSSRRSYQMLNSLSMKELPLRIRYKLLNTIQRLSTQSIGFDIYSIHTITYLRYFEIIIACVYGFLLVIGLKFTELQKNYF